jgi:hypothetical protein
MRNDDGFGGSKACYLLAARALRAGSGAKSLRRLGSLLRGFALAAGLLAGGQASAQSIAYPWSSFAHSPQHNAVAVGPGQPLNSIHWSTSVDYYSSNNSSYAHYASPLITRSNTVLVSVKTGTANGWVMKAFNPTNGALKWTQTSDFQLPPQHVWLPTCSPALTPMNRLYFPGGGGTVYYCDNPDSTNAVTGGQIAFYGLANYQANTNAYLSNVFISTPITSDRYGDIFFGFVVTGSNPLGLRSGLARIDFNGTGTWIAASSMTTNAGIVKVAVNCCPALSNDHKTLYVAVNSSAYVSFNDATDFGCLVSLDSRTLAPLTSVRLYDYEYPANNAQMNDNGTASPTVGPDGDVFYGVLETPQGANHDRGWLLHFNSTLTQARVPSAFGWDTTATIVPAYAVPSYTGSSSYLLATKYNNNTGGGGNGVEQVAIVDPHATTNDFVTGMTVMNVALAATAPQNNKEWCINSVAVDPFTKAIFANSEDGNAYRWDLTSNTLTQTNKLSPGYVEAYTPTVVGPDGTIYAINNSVLSAMGR